MNAAPIVLLLAGFAAADDRPPPAAVLTGIQKTAHFEIRFRPGSRAEASVDRTQTIVERDLTQILDRLEFKDWKETIQLYLYDDEKELQKITGVGAAGYSIPLQSHIPYDNDQTRLHELVHVVAERLPHIGSEPRNLFFAEGLANAVLEFVHGVPVDAVAAFYRREKLLPSIQEMSEAPDFYAWLGSHPGFNGYDVAGSWMLYLLDSFGAKKTRKYHTGTPAKEAFGKSLEELEKGWHARLDKFVLRPGLKQLLRERNGDKAEYSTYTPVDEVLTSDVLGPATEWQTLNTADFTTTGPGKFERSGDALQGRAPADSGDWTEAVLAATKFTDALVRVRVEPSENCFGVKVTLGPKCQAMLLKNGAFFYNEIGGVDFTDALKLGSGPLEIVLRRKSGRATVWIDGIVRLRADVVEEAATVAIGVVQGEAKFVKVDVRPLR